MPRYETILEKGNGNFLASGKVTLLDYAFFHFITTLIEYGMDLSPYKFILLHNSNFRKRPNIEKYLNSDRRNGLPNKTYVHEVRVSLG